MNNKNKLDMDFLLLSSDTVLKACIFFSSIESLYVDQSGLERTEIQLPLTLKC